MPWPKIFSSQSSPQIYPTSGSGGKFSQLSSPGYKVRQGIGNNGRSLLDECMTLEESKLERVKASSSYGISHVHYRVILPIKAKLFGLTSEQESNLDLYRTHMALCAEVDKVKSAFKAYRAAQETADNTPLESATERKEARKEAQAVGYKLLEKYDDLIKLAIEQAEDHELDKNQYLDDIQDELSKSYILQTINQIRARIPIERSALDFRDIDITYMHGLYRSLVTNFISHVHAAKAASGGRENSKEISKAFIRGLASIPELAERETLSALYDSLNDPKIVNQIQRIQMQNIENHFMEQLEILKDKQEDVTPEELAAIQCHGVNLSSVLPELTAAKLNDLKKANKARAEAVAEFFNIHREFEYAPQAQGLQYSYQDVEAFFRDIGKEEEMEDVLTEAKNDTTQDETPVGRLAREVLEIGELIRTEDNELAAIEEQCKKDYEALTECETVIADAEQEILRLGRIINEQNKALRELKFNINKLVENFEVFSKKSDPSQQQFAEAKKLYDSERLRQEELIENLEKEMKINQLKKTDETRKINKAKTDLNPLKNKAAKTGEQAMQALYSRARRIAPTISLSAEEIAQIAKYFGVEKPSSTKSQMAQQLSKTKAAIYAAHKAKIRDLIAQLKDQPFTMIKGEFTVNDNLFGGEDGRVQQCIKTQIALNIGIAKEVTRAVAKEVVEQKDKLYQSQQGPEEKRTHMQKRMGQRILPLATKLNIATFSSNGVLNAIEERFEAPLSLAGIEFCANICSKCDVGVPDIETSYEDADSSII